MDEKNCKSLCLPFEISKKELRYSIMLGKKVDALRISRLIGLIDYFADCVSGSWALINLHEFYNQTNAANLFGPL